MKSRIFTSAGNGIWLIESAMTPEDLQQQRRTYKVIVNDSSLFDSQWDSLEFEKIYVKYIRLTLTRTTGGNFVRLNEWELYQYVSLAYLKLEPTVINMKPAWQNKIRKVWRASEFDTILIDNSLVKWSCSDTSIAFVDSTGTIFGVAVLTLSKHYRKDVYYIWVLGISSGYQLMEGKIDLPPFSVVKVDFNIKWNFSIYNLEFIIPKDQYPEAEKENNSVSLYSYSLSAGFYVEESLYNYFREYQFQLNSGNNCWEDWVNSTLRILNFKFYDPSVDSSGPLMYEQYRIDKIVIVPDGSLPLDGNNSVTTPNFNDKSVDLIRGFPDSLIQTNMYNNHFSPYYTNPFYFDQAFFNDLLKARYLVDPVGFSVSDNGFGDIVNIKENGKYIGGTKFLPWESGKKVHKFQNSGLLFGDDENISIDEYSWNALSLIAGQRATLGNYNPPGNSGEYLNDLPQNNIVTILDTSGNPLTGANVRVFRSTGNQGVMYGKYYDSIPDMEFTCDEFGRVNLGTCPFDEFAAIFYKMNNANVVILIRVQQGDKAGYRFLDITEFNRHYWSGYKDTAFYDLTFNLFPVITSVNEEKNTSDDIIQIRYNSLNSSATAVIHLNQPSQINLALYTSEGRTVGEINESITIPGIHEISLVRLNLSTGLYFCRLNYDANYFIRKFFVY
ncbi:MAG: hypothetical protein HZB41_00285 [Ignavibacteriae bacterium]|nr:hypothetical protein [Ignavibacteriota bacterium]